MSQSQKATLNQNWKSQFIKLTVIKQKKELYMYWICVLRRFTDRPAFWCEETRQYPRKTYHQRHNRTHELILPNLASTSSLFKFWHEKAINIMWGHVSKFPALQIKSTDRDWNFDCGRNGIAREKTIDLITNLIFNNLALLTRWNVSCNIKPCKYLL